MASTTKSAEETLEQALSDMNHPAKAQNHPPYSFCDYIAIYDFASRRASDAKYAKDVNSERTYSAVAKWANARMVDMCVKIHMEYILGK